MNETINISIIAKNIKAIRMSHSLTQLEMAKILGYTERTIRRLETDGTDNISVINLIASTFNISAISILS